MSNSRSNLSSVSDSQLGVLLTVELDVVPCTTNRRDDSDNVFCRAFTGRCCSIYLLLLRNEIPIGKSKSSCWLVYLQDFKEVFVDLRTCLD